MWGWRNLFSHSNAREEDDECVFVLHYVCIIIDAGNYVQLQKVNNKEIERHTRRKSGQKDCLLRDSLTLNCLILVSEALLCYLWIQLLILTNFMPLKVLFQEKKTLKQHLEHNLLILLYIYLCGLLSYSLCELNSWWWFLIYKRSSTSYFKSKAIIGKLIRAA